MGCVALLWRAAEVRAKRQSTQVGRVLATDLCGWCCCSCSVCVCVCVCLVCSPCHVLVKVRQEGLNDKVKVQGCVRCLGERERKCVTRHGRDFRSLASRIVGHDASALIPKRKCPWQRLHKLHTTAVLLPTSSEMAAFTSARQLLLTSTYTDSYGIASVRGMSRYLTHSLSTLSSRNPCATHL
jgi:hypothetical protein